MRKRELDFLNALIEKKELVIRARVPKIIAEIKDKCRESKIRFETMLKGLREQNGVVPRPEGTFDYGFDMGSYYQLLGGFGAGLRESVISNMIYRICGNTECGGHGISTIIINTVIVKRIMDDTPEIKSIVESVLAGAIKINSKFDPYEIFIMNFLLDEEIDQYIDPNTIWKNKISKF